MSKFIFPLVIFILAGFLSTERGQTIKQLKKTLRQDKPS